MFCIVTVVRVHALYCDSGTCPYFELLQWYEKKMFENHRIKSSERDVSSLKMMQGVDGLSARNSETVAVVCEMVVRDR
jgi:hypothetical protein